MTIDEHLRPPLPARRSRGAHPRLRRRDLGGAAEASARATSSATRSARAGSRRPSTRSCAGGPGVSQLRVDSLGRPTSAGRDEAAAASPATRSALTLDIEAPAGRAAGRHRRDQPRAGRTRSGTRRPARSSRSTRGRRDPRARLVPDLRPDRLHAAARSATLAPLPRPEPSPRRRTSRRSTARSPAPTRRARRSSR